MDNDGRFADGKAAGALRTIGEVSLALGIKPHVLRYWEDQFPILKPLKRAGGRRLYRPEDVALLKRIDAMVNRDGYTLKGARAALMGGAGTAEDAPPSSTTRASVPEDLLSRLKTIRDQLASALAA